jgi:hypothetical protein
MPSSPRPSSRMHSRLERAAYFPFALLLALGGCDTPDRNFGDEEQPAQTAATSTTDAGAIGDSDPSPNSGDGGVLGTAGAGSGGMGVEGPDTTGQGGDESTSAGEGGGANLGGGGAVASAGGNSGGGSNNGGTNTGGADPGEAGGSNPAPYCGDGAVDDGEVCDPGAAPSTEAGQCAADCTLNACSDGDVRLCSEGGVVGNCGLGEQVCENGVYGECSIAPEMADTCASGDDADCDGEINESCGCSNGTVRNCPALGNCAMGEQVCENGEYGACSVTPGTSDSCAIPNDDTDCDGTPNGGCECEDGNTQPCGPSSDAGVCTFGTSTCSEGAWGECIGAVFPGARDCASNADNDCDGSADNVVSGDCACAVGTSRACDTHPGKDGFGVCEAGSQTCQAAADGSSSFWGTCTGSVGPQPADSCTMSGNDGNCDGVANGGCTCVQPATTTCGAEYGRQGDCADYTLSCGANGQWPAEATACAAQSGDSCAAEGQCLGGVWDDEAATFDDVCWQ